jgi:nicotinate dehydrogenase subunit A
VTTPLVVNGRRVEIGDPPTTPLLWALRDLGCFSVKYGCGLEQCGACRVLIERVPSAACRVDVGDVGDRHVETLEALAAEPAGQRVVYALLERTAAQCGYCLPGIVVTLTHLARQQAPGASPLTRADLVRALDPHLCRCGSQPRIIAAALDVLGDRS